MSLYILVEGRRTEKKIYPRWLDAVTSLKKTDTPAAPQKDHYYIFSGNGFPNVITHQLNNSIKEINEYGYDDFWIIIDSEGDDVNALKNKIKENIISYGINKNVKIHIIIQDVCIETFGLANNDYFPSLCDEDLSSYKERYDVTIDDPSLLVLCRETSHMNSAQFHEKYLKAIFKSNGDRYTKNHPGKFQSEEFFLGIKKRHNSTGHISSFGDLLKAIDSISR